MVMSMFSEGIRRYGTVVLDWLLPPVCPVTGEIVEQHGIIAPSAWAKLTFVADPKCCSCGVPFAFDQEMTPYQAEGMKCADCLAEVKPYDRAVSALVYDDGSREMVLRFKHGDQLQSVAVFLPWLLKAGEPILNDADLIVPVPLHPWRLIKRRYNQAALLSAAIAKSCQIKHNATVLRRIRMTKSQGHLSQKMRKSNVYKAFDLKSSDLSVVQGKNVVLVDDVLTTGATIEACSQVLLEGGASKVSVLTLARAVKN